VLPAYRNTFLGRAGELRAIDATLSTAGAVTLLGPGGIGKTRLAVEFATQARDRYADGAWLVDLSGVRGPAAFVWNTVCETLALDVAQPSATAIGDALAERSMLLVLDTCEQITTAVAELVETLASRAPGVATIVTSRTRTGYRGERTVAVEPLGWSGGDTAAVDLVLSRAAEAGVVVDAEALVANVCAAASGMPLAIELAVAQLAHLTVPELLARMDDQPNLLLADGSSSRHSSIRTAFATSLELLSSLAHAVLLTSAAFRSSFALVDITAVHGADAEPAARELVAASLWSSAAASGEMRFAQLEPVRQFTYARLVDSGRDGEVHARHAEYFVNLVRDEALGLRRAVEPDVVSANLAAAHDWARTHGHHDLAARVATAMLSAPAMLHPMAGGATMPASSLGGIA
jgi:predicted ATPase